MIVDDDDTYIPPARVVARKPPQRVRGETERTNDVLAWLNAQPFTCAIKKHTNAYGQGGHPDIIGCRGGRTLMVEMKRPGETPTLRQLERLRTWQDAGAAVCWASDVEHVQQLFARLDEEPARMWKNPLTGPGAPP